MTLKIRNEILAQMPKPNKGIHKKPPEVKFLNFLNFPYFFRVR